MGPEIQQKIVKILDRKYEMFEEFHGVGRLLVYGVPDLLVKKCSVI
jgi:hypothetical protein